MASTKLYPPILNSYINAFTIGGYLRIPFKLSSFNTKSDFKSIHCMINRLDTNQTCLNKTLYPNGIKIINDTSNLQYQENEIGFYIDITDLDIEGGWQKGLYKIQLRISEIQYDEKIKQSEWLVSHSNSFSEWSTVAITKAIGIVNINDPVFFPNAVDTDGDEKVFYLSSLDFIGSYDNHEDPSESLDTYQLILSDINGEIIEDSGIKKATTQEPLSYSFKHESSSSIKYKLKFEGITRNFYSLKREVIFTVEDLLLNPVRAEIYTKEEDRGYDEEEGCVTVYAKGDENENFSGNLNIRRSSSRDNFSEWIDIYNTSVNGEPIDICFKDYTIESGIFYRYSIRKIDINTISGSVVKDYGTPVYMTNPCVREFEYSYLLGKNNKQLRLSFGHAISSYQRKNSIRVNDDTIGGKYPFITKKGYLNYVSFPINGCISFESDENHSFLTEEELFGGDQNYSLYEERNHNSSYDYIKEKLFREKVIEFLQDGEPKLYKSSQEGNLIVGLTDVSLTPNNSLGRLVYDFSANVSEIDEISQDNLIKYGFYSLTELMDEFKTETIKVGQYINNSTKINTDIKSEIVKAIDFGSKSILGYTYKTDKIYKVKIKFNSKPMLILDQNNQETLGYKMSINGTTVVVGRFGEYVLDSSIPLTSLIFYGDKQGKISSLDVQIDFIYNQIRALTPAKIIKNRTTSKNIGQYFGSLECGANIYSLLYYRYYFEWKTEYQRLVQISKATIQGNPNTVFEIKDYHDDKFNKHMIGNTGVLNLSEFDGYLSVINNIKVFGTYYGEKEKMIEVNVNSLDISDNAANKIYVYENNYYVYRRGTFLKVIVEDGKIYDTETPVNVVVDYMYSSERGTYYDLS